MEFTDEIQISGWGSWCVVMDEDGSVGYSSTGVRALCRLEKKVAPVYEGLTQTPPRKVLGESIYICRSFRLVVKKCDSKFPLGVMSASVEKQSRNFHKTTNRPLFCELQKKTTSTWSLGIGKRYAIKLSSSWIYSTYLRTRYSV